MNEKGLLLNIVYGMVPVLFWNDDNKCKLVPRGSENLLDGTETWYDTPEEAEEAWNQKQLIMTEIDYINEYIDIIIDFMQENEEFRTNTKLQIEDTINKSGFLKREEAEILSRMIVKRMMGIE